jgi:hypothetical protein
MPGFCVPPKLLGGDRPCQPTAHLQKHLKAFLPKKLSELLLANLVLICHKPRQVLLR